MLKLAILALIVSPVGCVKAQRKSGLASRDSTALNLVSDSTALIQVPRFHGTDSVLEDGISADLVSVTDGDHVDPATVEAMARWADNTFSQMHDASSELSAVGFDELQERLSSMSRSTENMRSQLIVNEAQLPVMYLFSGCDLFNAVGLFPRAPGYLLWAQFPVGDPRCFADAGCAANASKAATTWWRHVVKKSFAASQTAVMLDLFGGPHGVLAGLLLSQRILNYTLTSAQVRTAGSEYPMVVLESRVSSEDHDGEQSRNVQVKYVGAWFPEDPSIADLDRIEASVLGATRWANVFRCGADQITRGDTFVSRLLANWSLVVVQDETGPPLGSFRKHHWSFQLSGRFVSSVKLDGGHGHNREAIGDEFRAEFEAADKRGELEQLAFDWGYPSEKNRADVDGHFGALVIGFPPLERKQDVHIQQELLGTGSSMNDTPSQSPSIHWLHIPKTGSTFGTTVVHYVCGNGLQDHETLYTYHTKEDWRKKCGKGGDQAFSAGHKSLWPPSQEDDKRLSRVVFMCRDPVQRTISGWFDDRSGCRAASDIESYALCTNSLAAAMLAGIPMLNYSRKGDGPDAQATPFFRPSQTRDLKEHTYVDRLNKLGFVGLSDEFALSVCLFHAMYGGECLPIEFINERPGRKSQHSARPAKMVTGPHGQRLYDVAAVGLENYSSKYGGHDLTVWHEAQSIFWRNVKKYGVSKETCANKYCPLARKVFLEGCAPFAVSPEKAEGVTSSCFE